MKRVAFITGSSRGIGKSIAIRLAKDGFQIVLHGRTKSQELLTTQKELELLDRDVFSTSFDVSKSKEVNEGCRLILKHTGGIDVLINNAGIIQDKTLIKMTDKEWDNVIKTNLYGSFYITRNILASMKERKGGRIINISSIVAQKGNFGQTNYAASKAGLIGLTKSLAREVSKYGITVNAVCPGLISTEIIKKIPDVRKQQLLSEIINNQVGTSNDVANVVSFLSREESSYITGSVINVDGGWL